MQKIVKFDNFILKYLFMIIILYTFASLNNIKCRICANLFFMEG